METLGVSFSEFKGFNSTSEVKVAEFAKGLYLNGKDISAISPRPLNNFVKDFKFVIPLLDNLPELDEALLSSLLLSHPRKYHQRIRQLIVGYFLFEGKPINQFLFEDDSEYKIFERFSDDGKPPIRRAVIANLIASYVYNCISSLRLGERTTLQEFFNFPEAGEIASYIQACGQQLLNLYGIPSRKIMEVSAFFAKAINGLEEGSECEDPKLEVLYKSVKEGICHPVLIYILELLETADQASLIFSGPGFGNNKLGSGSLFRDDWTEVIKDLKSFVGKREVSSMRTTSVIFERSLPEQKALKMFTVSTEIYNTLRDVEIFPGVLSTRIVFKTKLNPEQVFDIQVPHECDE
jgi:hypothetical protein